MQYSAHRTIRHSKCIGISACLSPRTSDKSLTHPFGVLRSSKWRLSSWRFPFYCRRCFSEVSHPQQYSIVTRDTIVPMNIEVPTKYPLSQNDRIVVFEIRLHSESPMLYRPGLHGNWNALSLAGRALKDKFRQRFHSQLCCQIVRYFCRTLYFHFDTEHTVGFEIQQLYIYIYICTQSNTTIFYSIVGYQFRSLRPSSGQCCTKL